MTARGAYQLSPASGRDEGSRTAAATTRDLSRDSGDHVIVVHVHEFAT